MKKVIIILAVVSFVISTIMALVSYQIQKLKQELMLKNAVVNTFTRKAQDLINIKQTIGTRYAWMSDYEAEFYAYWFKKWADRTGCDWYLFCALARKESLFNPNAVSRKGAKGVFQLMPDTFLDQCQRLHINPRRGQAVWVDVVNLVCGMDYLVQAKVKNSYDIEPMLRRYNCGSDSGRNVETDEFTVSVPSEMERLRLIYIGVQNDNKLQDQVRKSSNPR